MPILMAVMTDRQRQDQTSLRQEYWYWQIDFLKFSLDAMVVIAAASYEKWVDRHFKPGKSVCAYSMFGTLNTSVIHSLLGHVASSTPVSFTTSTSNMAQASKAKAGGKKPQGKATKPQGPG